MTTPSSHESESSRSHTNTLLNVEQLSVDLAGALILREVSFKLTDGEFVVVVGPNGAGKTTLLRTLLGATPLSDGRISLAGSDVSEYSVVARAQFMSYVPQGRDVPAGFTVREFVEMGLYAQGYRFALTEPLAETLQMTLQQTGLTALADRFLETLSGGELQRAYLAAALIQNARIMLLDEPTTFLDPAHQREMVSILTQARKENPALSAMIVTHDLNLAVSFADRILTLKDGAVVFDGAPQEFCDERRLYDIYQTTMRLVKDPQSDKPLILPALISDTESKHGGEAAL